MGCFIFFTPKTKDLHVTFRFESWLTCNVCETQKSHMAGSSWQTTADILERDGFAVIEDALSPAQVSLILERSLQYVVERQHGNMAAALQYSSDFLALVDVPGVLDVVSHWLGPNVYVNHSHITWRPAGAGPPNAWHRDGGDDLRGCSRLVPMFLKVGFVLTDMSKAGNGNFGCLPLARKPVWETVEGTDRPVIVNADTLLLRPGTAVLFEQCWHSGLSNVENAQDRCVFYVQFARRILQPLDPADYTTLRSSPLVASCPVRQQLLPIASDVQYSPHNRSSVYYPVGKGRSLPLLERQKQRGIPCKRFRMERRNELPDGCEARVVPSALAAQVDALISAHEQHGKAMGKASASSRWQLSSRRACLSGRLATAAFVVPLACLALSSCVLVVTRRMRRA